MTTITNSILLTLIFVTLSGGATRCDNGALLSLQNRDSASLTSDEKEFLQELQDNCAGYRKMSETQKTMYEFTQSRLKRNARRRRIAIIVGMIVPGVLAIGAVSHIATEWSSRQ